MVRRASVLTHRRTAETTPAVLELSRWSTPPLPTSSNKFWTTLLEFWSVTVPRLRIPPPVAAMPCRFALLVLPPE